MLCEVHFLMSIIALVFVCAGLDPCNPIYRDVALCWLVDRGCLGLRSRDLECKFSDGGRSSPRLAGTKVIALRIGNRARAGASALLSSTMVGGSSSKEFIEHAYKYMLPSSPRPFWSTGHCDDSRWAYAFDTFLCYVRWLCV